MDILKTATDWAKAEVFSAQFFIFFGVLFLIGSIGFWQLGKTELAKAYIIPLLVAGLLLATIGVGLLIANKSRVTSFVKDYNQDSVAFVKSEIIRTEKTINDFQNTVYKAIPIIIIIAALLFIFINKPVWRAISTTTIAMMIVIIMIDTNSYTRYVDYHKELIAIEKQE